MYYLDYGGWGILHMMQREKTHMNTLSFSAKVISQLEQ